MLSLLESRLIALIPFLREFIPTEVVQETNGEDERLFDGSRISLPDIAVLHQRLHALESPLNQIA